MNFSLQEVIEAKRLEFYLEKEEKEKKIKQQFVQKVNKKAAVLEEAEQQASMPVCLEVFFCNLKQLSS